MKKNEKTTATTVAQATNTENLAPKTAKAEQGATPQTTSAPTQTPPCNPRQREDFERGKAGA